MRLLSQGADHAVKRLIQFVSRLDEKSGMDWIVFDRLLNILYGVADEKSVSLAQTALKTGIIVEDENIPKRLALPFRGYVIIIKNFQLSRREYLLLLQSMLEGLDI